MTRRICASLVALGVAATCVPAATAAPAGYHRFASGQVSKTFVRLNVKGTTSKPRYLAIRLTTYPTQAFNIPYSTKCEENGHWKTTSGRLQTTGKPHNVLIKKAYVRPASCEVETSAMLLTPGKLYLSLWVYHWK
jgi:hypothetical protein